MAGGQLEAGVSKQPITAAGTGQDAIKTAESTDATLAHPTESPLALLARK
jgi:hypothetical protein